MVGEFPPGPGRAAALSPLQEGAWQSRFLITRADTVTESSIESYLDRTRAHLDAIGFRTLNRSTEP